MGISKTLLIGGLTTVIVAGSIGAYLILDKPSNQAPSKDALLKDYQELLSEVSDSKTKTNLSDDCKNIQKFNEQIQLLENKLDILKQKKNDLTNTKDPEEYIPQPGSQPLNLVESVSEEGGYIPKPGSQPLDLVEPHPGVGEKIQEEFIPKPGSQPLDLVEPTPGGGDYIPKAGSQPLNLVESANINQINTVELEIIAELNNLKSLCNKDEGKVKEIISTSCPDACKKYYDCASYTEGSTKEDQQDAYDSCMLECAKWSDETKICINKQIIKTVTDCSNFSICALKEYGNPMDR